MKNVLSGYDFKLQLEPSLADDLTSLGTRAQENGNIDEGVTLPDYNRFFDRQFVTA